jgi:CHASE3 domain sensor protein
MEISELDDLKLNFQRALEQWVRSIERLREVLAETSHSARSEDIWRQADFEQDEAQKAVKDAREAYETAVRKANFGF